VSYINKIRFLLLVFGVLLCHGGGSLQWYKDLEEEYPDLEVKAEEIKELANDEFSLAEAAFIEGYEEDEEEYE
jgi:hypothetical protein